MADWNWDNIAVDDIVNSYEDNDVSFSPKDYWNDSATFIGPKSDAWNHKDFKLAKELEKQGVSPKEIWRRTGTGRSIDGQWRQEITDHWVDERFSSPNSVFGVGSVNGQDLSEFVGDRVAMPSYPHNFISNPKVLDVQGGLLNTIDALNDGFSPRDPSNFIGEIILDPKDNEGYVPGGVYMSGGLGSLLYHKDLWDAYPGIQTTPVAVDHSPQASDGGMFFGTNYPETDMFADSHGLNMVNQRTPKNVGRGSIVLNSEGFRDGRYSSDRDRRDKLLDTLLHENQHTIQTIENFGQGGTPDAISLDMINDRNNPLNQYAGYRELSDDERKFGIYNNLPGELEARNTSDRKFLNKQQRREQFPFVQQDGNNPYGMQTQVPFEVAQDLYQWYNQPSVQSLLGK
jgi:hypothetical protein